jgi:hypothetical protein
MAQVQNSAEKWLSQNQHRMINCPYQPGNLFISQNACAKRHQSGDREAGRNPLRDDILAFQWKKGISVCQKCPIGRTLTSRVSREPGKETNPGS